MAMLYWTLPIGVFVGLLARMLQPDRDRVGVLPGALLGMAGSAAATYAGQSLGFYAGGGAAAILGATLGAIALLTVLATLRWLAR
jgi:uncharacterized membrane protein YeaQ/YmgE (transglycosylase-associated protein family)